MRFTVEVDVATCRPPKVDATATVVVDSHSALDAEWVAIAMVCCHPHVVMPVGSRVIDIKD
jgi:hypothetical protein